MPHRFFARRYYIATVATLSFVLFIVIIYAVFAHGALSVIDVSINAFFATHTSPAFTAVMRQVTFFGDWAFFVFPAAFFASLALHAARLAREAALVAFATFVGGALGFALKNMFAIPRPAGELIGTTDLFSFPSGHATVATLFFGSLVCVAAGRIKNQLLRFVIVAFFVLAIVFVSLSRLYLGVHWFSDVLGGITLGVFFVSFSVLLSEYGAEHIRRLRHKRLDIKKKQ